MLNAAEAAIDASADDDSERARNRAKLYALPAGERRAPGQPRPRPPGMALDIAKAQALAAQLAAEDAKLAGGATG